MSEPLPHITLVLPVLNEAAYIEDCLRSLLDDPYPRERIEVLVVDGASTDDTVAIVERLKQEFPVLRVLANPRRLQAAAFNLAWRAAHPLSRWLIRCDAHARYPRGFISRCVAAGAQSGAALIVYADAPIGRSCFQRAVAYAQNSKIGVGGAVYRLGTVSGFVDHGKHGAFRRDILEADLLYDESFAINEDSELSHRIIAAGHRIWLEKDLAVGYFPRHNVTGLWRQYYRYGKGRVRTYAKHNLTMKPRQAATILLLAGNIASVLGGALVHPFLFAFVGAYVLALLAAAIAGAIQRRDACVVLSALAYAVMHHAWPIGYLKARLFGDAH
jgi:succinoglycan biosynthesis protein ExoA